MARSKVIMDIEKLRSVANYCHHIPITRGYYRVFISENFPGWHWNHFIPKLMDNEIVVVNRKGDPEFVHLKQGLYIKADVVSIEFLPKTSGSVITVNRATHA